MASMIRALRRRATRAQNFDYADGPDGDEVRGILVAGRLLPEVTFRARRPRGHRNAGSRTTSALARQMTHYAEVRASIDARLLAHPDPEVQARVGTVLPRFSVTRRWPS